MPKKSKNKSSSWIFSTKSKNNEQNTDLAFAFFSRLNKGKISPPNAGRRRYSAKRDVNVNAKPIYLIDV